MSRKQAGNRGRKSSLLSSRKRRVLVSGNEAMAQAAVLADCSFYAGYPITPQNELIARMAVLMRETGRVFVQAESEIAAINMVFGASSTGARAMTSSSSPGISLKQEGISYLAGAQLPCVIINVARGGPGLGNIASAQGDYFQSTRGGGHGDYYTPVFSPWNVEEAARLVMLAFDVADYYRTPVMVLSDALIGQMMEPLAFPENSGFRKKLPPKLWALTGSGGFRPNVVKSFFIQEGGLEQHNQVLAGKWKAIKKSEQMARTYLAGDADLLIISYGSQARMAKAAVDLLRRNGIKAGLFRPVSLWPFPEKKLRQLARGDKRILVVEQSLGQMIEDVKLSLIGINEDVAFLGRAGGGIPSPSEIVRAAKKLVNSDVGKK